MTAGGMSSSEVLAVRASPRGSRAGFVVLPDGEDGALTITVLPKPWNGSTVRRLLIPEHAPGSSTHITLFEGESAEVGSSLGVVGALTHAVLDIGDREGRKDLLQLTRARGNGTIPPPTDTDPFESVISLMLLANRQKTSLGEHTYQGNTTESLLRIVEQQLFVEEVRRVINRTKPGYLERTDVLASPRGALLGTSLALALVTGSPQIACRFDEQSTDTAVLRIVLAALRTVAVDQAPKALARIAAPIRSTAVALARRLDGVTVLERERALVTARRLVLHKLEQPWASALGRAVQVLTRTSVVPVDGHTETDRAVAIHLSMEKWWEQCLCGALQHVADVGSLHPQAPVGSPWVSEAGTSDPDLARRADFIFSINGRRFLADAKYKINDSHLDAADGDQMFAYSHTATEPGSDQLTEAGLVLYPATVRGEPRTSDVLIRTTGPHYELRRLHLPFPSPTDVRSEVRWRTYLATLAISIEQELAPTATLPRRVVPLARL